MDAKLKAQYTEIIKSKDIILLAVGGSELLGLQSKGSDHDLIGVYVEPMSDIAGFRNEQHITWRSAEARTGKVGEPSKSGDTDLTLYGLRKFLRLALAGNPTILNVLYTHTASCPILTDAGKSLQALAPDIVSRQAGHAFLGYMQQQRLRMQRGITLNGRGVGNPDGCNYDIKHALHMIRLGIQGVELLRTGELSLPISSDYRPYLQSIKDGEISEHGCMTEAEGFEQNIKNLMQAPRDEQSNRTLRDKPDYEKVENWMLNVYAGFWKV